MNPLFSSLKRWLLLIYTIFATIITVIYIMFNSTFYKLDWLNTTMILIIIIR